MTATATNGRSWVVADRELPHQIRFLRITRGPGFGGLGVWVSCTCMSKVPARESALGDRCIESLEDAWRLYREHVEAS